MANMRANGMTRARAAAPLAVALCAVVGMSATAEDRTINGENNNLTNTHWGAADIHLVRMSFADYADGIAALAGPLRENPRVISNAVIHQDTSNGVVIPDPRGLTDYTWAWGQFIDHDIGETPTDGPGSAFIQVPTGDPWYDPEGDGAGLLPFRRSRIDFATGTDVNNPREQVNAITAYIDGSAVYGSEDFRADWLRTFSGGKMKMFADVVNGDMLPFNDGTIPNAGGNDVTLFVGGDVRANETSSLTSLHTLWVREHNRLADEIAKANPGWDDDQIFQRARKIVGALLQKITYDEFLPALLGSGAIAPYAGYDANVDASIRTEFSTAAYRVGHTMLSPNVLRLDEFGDVIPAGNLSLRDSFFDPDPIMLDGGMEPIFRGLAAGQMQQVDALINDDVRIFLFNEIGSTPPAMDLAALNIQRGRDHGLPDFNSVRVAYGLAPHATYADISSDPTVQANLASVYPDINDIDPWVGMVAEDLVPGASVGETVRTILIDQFTRLRDGDRFWYENDPELSGLLSWIDSQKLSHVIIRNTNVAEGEIQENLFFVACPGDLDGDLAVNGADLAAMLAVWNTSDSASDLNGDGVVDGADLAALLANWGSCI